MSTVRYTTVQGEVIAEKRTGVRSQYVPDVLGSTVALLNNSQTQTDTFSYYPYGTVASRTGTTSTPYQFVGTAGYYTDPSGKTYVRARYLDNAKGKWLTQARFVEQLAGEHPYGYAFNNPVTYIDLDGNRPKKPWVIGAPVPTINTAICDGKGHITYQIGNMGNAEQIKCLKGCAIVHEKSHITDAKAAGPNVCKGQKKGVTVRPPNEPARKATEIKASNAEINCLKTELKKCPVGCAEIINNRITQMEQYRDSFK